MNARVFVLVLPCLLAGAICAQTGTGNIQGTVRDATGAVVPQAKVTIVQTQTTRQYDSVTNEVGFYLFPSVQLGPYQITVEAAGKTQVRLVVEDDGPGFPPAMAVRGESGAGSTGLGLDIVRRAAERTGGSLAISAGHEGGARVEVLFGFPDPPTDASTGNDPISRLRRSG